MHALGYTIMKTEHIRENRESSNDRMYTSMTKIDVEDFDESLFSSARCFHTTGITLALSEKTRETAIEMIKRFKQAEAMISFDVNFRGNLWTGEEARACIERILPYVDVFFCSEETARLNVWKRRGMSGRL